MKMPFRFTKLPDAFELCHHLFVSNTVFQKMRSLTVLGVFFQSSCGIANRSRRLDESATPESISTIMSFHATVHLSLPLANDKSISLPLVYEHVILNRQDHFFNWSSWKCHHPVAAAALTQRGKWCRNRLRWEILLMFHQQQKVICHRLAHPIRESAVFTYVIPSVYRTLMVAIVPLK